MEILSETGYEVFPWIGKGRRYARLGGVSVRGTT